MTAKEKLINYISNEFPIKNDWHQQLFDSQLESYERAPKELTKGFEDAEHWAWFSYGYLCKFGSITMSPKND